MCPYFCRSFRSLARYITPKASGIFNHCLNLSHMIFWVVIKLGILSSLASAFQICKSTFDKSTPRKHEREKICSKKL